jgi:hypothetical protein
MTLLLLLAVFPPQQLSALRALEKLRWRKAKENLGQCKSEDGDFKK